MIPQSRFSLNGSVSNQLSITSCDHSIRRESIGGLCAVLTTVDDKRERHPTRHSASYHAALSLSP